MKKFIKGTFELDKNVVDLVSYEEKKKVELDKILEWAYHFEILLRFGTSADNYYLCEYRIVANTNAMCKGLLQELKAELKTVFPYVKMVWQGSGDVLR